MTLTKKIATAFRLCGIRYCVKVPNFPLKVAAETVAKWNVNGNYYDYSCGWGSRLLAALQNNVNYFGTEDSQFLNRVQDEIRLVAYVHFLYLLKFLHLDGDETGRIQIRHSVQHLEELLPKVGRLNSWSLE